MRRQVLAATAVAAMAAAALAQERTDERTGARYQLSAVDGGFIRLDTRTGDVSHCTKAAGVWRCEPATEAGAAKAPAASEGEPVAPGDTAELERRLDALAAGLAALRNEVDALRAALPEAMAGQGVEKVDDEQRPFDEEVASRLFRLMAGIKRSLRD